MSKLRAIIANEVLIQRKVSPEKNTSRLARAVHQGITYEEWVSTMEFLAPSDYEKKYKPRGKLFDTKCHLVIRLLGGYVITLRNGLFCHRFASEVDEHSEMWSEELPEVLKALWEIEVKDKVE